MWITINTRLPIQNPPPKLSMFWSVPWPDHEYASKQGVTCLECGEVIRKGPRYAKVTREELLEGATSYHGKLYLERGKFTCGCNGDPIVVSEDADSLPDVAASFLLKDPKQSPFREQNWVGARKIRYMGEDIRVFPNEFNPCTPQKMAELIFGEAYELIPDDVATEKLLGTLKDSDQKVLYEYALLEGADHNQAVQAALGMDVTVNETQFPAVGWYRLRPEYAAFFD